MIKVIEIQPNKRPRVIEIENTLKAFQEKVAGHIELFRISTDVVAIVNEEGILYNMEPNKAIFFNDKLSGLLFGPILIASDAGDDLGGLDEDQISRYMELFSKEEKVSVHGLFIDAIRI